jgi:hypothetical protein
MVVANADGYAGSCTRPARPSGNLQQAACPRSSPGPSYSTRRQPVQIQDVETLSEAAKGSTSRAITWRRWQAMAQPYRRCDSCGAFSAMSHSTPCSGTRRRSRVHLPQSRYLGASIYREPRCGFTTDGFLDMENANLDRRLPTAATRRRTGASW